MIRKHIKNHGKWLVVLSLVIFVMTMYVTDQILRIKGNYTELWRKVDQIERECYGQK